MSALWGSFHDFPTAFKRDWRKLPNLVTLSRLALSWVPALFIVIWPQDFVMRLVAVGLFALVAATDSLDGYLARSRDEVTELGMFLDPLVDKVYVFTTLVALSALVWWPLWFLTIFVALRELIVNEQIARRHKITQPPLLSGKIKTFAQMVALGVFMLPIEMVWAGWVIVQWVAYGLAAFVTAHSWGTYHLAYIRHHPVVRR